jgi:hypothetical protein
LEKSLYISQVIFVVHERHFALLGSMKYRESAISELGQILTVNQTPNGQALSAAKALDVIADNSGFVIWNGDSAISQGWSESVSARDNWLLVSRLAGTHWSFVESENGRVIRTAEKERISPHASLGLYGFENKKIYLRALAAQSSRLGEAYVAPLYNEMLAAQETVTSAEIESHLFQPFGTPQELIFTCNRNGWSIPDGMPNLDSF